MIVGIKMAGMSLIADCCSDFISFQIHSVSEGRTIADHNDGGGILCVTAFSNFIYQFQFNEVEQDKRCIWAIREAKTSWKTDD